MFLSFFVPFFIILKRGTSGVHSLTEMKYNVKYTFKDGNKMKRGTFRKIIYVIISLFLLCSFFSIGSPDEYEANALSATSSVATISVPHGIHMEIKNEERNANSEVFVKEKSQRNISFVKYLFLATLSFVTSGLLLCAVSNSCNESFCNSRFSIIEFIHNKDGRKRR